MEAGALSFSSRARSAAAVAAALVVAGCGSAATETAATAALSDGFPVSVQNCGVEVTVEAPPTRAVGYYQQSVETMLTLGLQDVIVGTVYPDNPPLPQFAEAYQEIPEISDKDASFEQVLAVDPDFVYGSYSSAFDGSAGRSRQAFADAGITTYANPENCAAEPIVMEDVYREMRTVAELFGVPERADGVIAEMQASVTAATGKTAGVRPLRTFVYDSGDQTAFTAGGQGIGNQIIELAGGTNIFGDVAETFADVSWEQVVERDPEVIVIYDYFGTPSVPDKLDLLRSRPELAGVPAIRDDRFAVLTLQDAVLGVRAPYAVEALGRQLHPDRFR